MNQDLKLTALISSRICHDLISPVGAISNGLELLSMSGVKETEELTLIGDSVRTAAANLKFMRIAFGAGTTSESFSVKSLSEIADAYFASPRLTLQWLDINADATRADAKLAFLLTLAAVAAMPLGGMLRISGLGASPLSIRAGLSGTRIGFDEASQNVIDGTVDAADADPRQAPLALLLTLAEQGGLTFSVDLNEEGGFLTLSA